MPRENEPLEKRVKRGAKLLDKKAPDWFKKTRVTKLEMSNPYSCVLHETFGGWGLGLDTLKIETLLREECRYAFDLLRNEYPDMKKIRPLWNGLWKAEIKTRREASKRNENKRGA
jgi:hypothetical protein